MGKWNLTRHPSDANAPAEKEAATLNHFLPPPPPLQPRPRFDADPSAAVEEPEAAEPLDYSMKGLLGLATPPSPSSPSRPSSRVGSGGAESPRPATPGDDVLHRLRHTLQQRNRDHRGGCRLSPTPTATLTLLKATAAIGRRPHHQVAASRMSPTTQEASPAAAAAAAAADPKTDAMATFAAERIRSRLDGCGKRVHLFLGILLHFGMPPGPNGEAIFNRVIAFSDEQKHATDWPSAYFIVLDSKLLALIWSKFKGNSSNEYSTLTRAIRSTRQKYKGIFETVENPGKKLYKFGSVALEQFRQLFPASYTNVEAA